LGGTDSTVSDLTVQVSVANGAAGLVLAGTTATRVAVTGASLTNATGVLFPFGGRFANGSVDLAGTPTTTGVSAGSFGGGLVTDSRIAAPIGDTKVPLQRVRVVASAVGASTSPGVTDSSSSLTLEDVLVQLTAVGAVGIEVSSSASFISGAQSANLTLRHVTVAGVGDGSSVGVQATATGGTSFDGRTPIPANVTVTLASTLLTVAKPLDARLVNSGSVFVLSDFSDWDQRAASATGGVLIMRGSHDVNVAPGFANAPGGDFSLAAGSPLVDRGDVALPADESTTDAAGAPRVVDGNGDGVVSSDVGAFEFQPPRLPAPPGGGGGSGPAAPPTLSRLALSHARFAVGSGATARSAARRHRRARRAPRGTTISFTLSRAASVAFTVERRQRGLRKGRRCVAPTRRLRRSRARACTRFTTSFAFTRSGAAGPNSIPFSGRARRRALAAGSYRLTATATADGRSSAPTRPVAFAIIRG
jgi:hypothetical protein